MKVLWVLCLCLVGKLHTASAAEEKADGSSNLDTRYMMAFPMGDDQQAEESAEVAVKAIADALIGGDKDQDVKEPVVLLDIEEKKDTTDEDNVEPMGILEAQMEEEDSSSKQPRRSLFKRPKIEDLRKILGFPSADANAPKPKVIPPEKPKAFQSMFKPKPKTESSPNGFQISLPLRREDRTRPFGFPMLPLQRNEGIIRPFGFPDLVQAASSIIRRAIIDDMDAQDINKDDKDAEEEEEETNEEQESNSNSSNNNNNANEEETEEEEEDDDDEPLMIVPIPDGKVDPMLRPPIFRRFPLPLPFPVPRPMAETRPRLPMPPLAPVALFLPLAQQIMQNIMSRSAPRSQPPPPPLLPVAPIHQFVPIQPPMQNLIPIVPIQHNMIPVHPPMAQPIQHLIPIHTPFIPQQSMQAPILIPLIQNVPEQMARRMPVPQQHPAMVRRLPMPNPMARMPIAPQHLAQVPHFINHLAPRPIAEPTRHIQRLVRPQMPPVHPVFLMVPTNVPMMPQQQQQIPIFHRPPQQIPFFQQQQQFPVFHRQQVPIPMPSSQDEERIILVRADPEEQDDDQEVLVLVPTDEVEVAQRPAVFQPQQVFRPPPVATPIQRMRLLRELLMARQNNRQQSQMQAMASQARPRIVEIVQQQLRIIPHQHRGQQQVNPTRVEASELHPVYVPYPGPQ